MIVLEGTPGVGKTTLLGRLLAALPDRLVVFPEAQPPSDAGDEAEIAHALLAEDHARIAAAKTLNAVDPSLIVASDRCYLGVLAYRYALASLGRAPWRDFHHAMALVEELGLAEGHRQDTVIVLLLDAGASVRRRAGHAQDRRYALWFDLDFLAAYNDFWGDLARWAPVAASWTLHDTTTTTGWSAITAALPFDALPSALGGGGHGADRRLSGACGCVCPRSAVVPAGDTANQLFTSAVHRRRGDGPVVCLRDAERIAADWLAVSWPQFPRGIDQGG